MKQDVILDYKKDLILEKGKGVMIFFEDEDEIKNFGDLLQGLIISDNGDIYFEGNSIKELQSKKDLSFRYRIGRVFLSNAWINNIDVLENILIKELYHTQRLRKDIIEEVDKLAREFGMKDVPKRRPFLVSKKELQLAQLTRAFLGSPKMLILENPDKHLALDNISLLFNKLNEIMNNQSGFIWLTDSKEVWEETNIDNMQKIILKEE